MEEKRFKTKKINYKEDELLSEKNIYVGGDINIYQVLFKKDDLKDNKKGMILKKCPYISDNTKDIEKLIYNLKDKNFMNLRRVLSEYLDIKIIRKDTFYNWLNKKIYPLPLVRIICLLTNKNITEIIKNKKITDFCNQSQIKLPISYDEIISDFMAFFIGLHFGDGTLNEERWKIVDGDMDKENLKYSYEFLNKIKDKICRIFLINSARIYKIKNKNAYELIISNKWFSRYLNFVYGLEQKQKENPYIPKIFNNKKELVLRGLFDTDGSIKNFRVSIGTKYYNLYKEIHELLDNYKIEYREKKNNIQRNVFFASSCR